jgi:hypothetical protein
MGTSHAPQITSTLRVESLDRGQLGGRGVGGYPPLWSSFPGLGRVEGGAALTRGQLAGAGLVEQSGGRHSSAMRSLGRLRSRTSTATADTFFRFLMA